jgi:1-phosphatidylinositol phosphodiesterase
MSRLNDNLRLIEAKIPGTHNSAADCAIESSSVFGRFASVVAQCQDLDLVSQLERGIRYFDIRLKLDDFELRVYHGPCFCGHTFSEILSHFAVFLRESPSEFLIIEIHRWIRNFPLGGQFQMRPSWKF